MIILVDTERGTQPVDAGAISVLTDRDADSLRRGARGLAFCDRCEQFHPDNRPPVSRVVMHDLLAKPIKRFCPRSTCCMGVRQLQATDTVALCCVCTTDASMLLQ